MSNEKNICPKCGTETTMFYCPECGEIIEYPSFVDDNEGRKNSLQEFVREVITFAKQKEIEVKSAIDGSVIRNAVYRHFYEKMAYLQELCSNGTTKEFFEHDGIKTFDRMSTFVKKCEEEICQIAVVGTVKAGKSSFINALIGRKIASSYPTPETASLTKFRKSEKGDYVKVSFYETNEWNKLWDSVTKNTSNIKRKEDEDKGFLDLYNELNAEQIRAKYLDKEDITFEAHSLDELKGYVDRFTSARFAEHFFAKEVEVGLSDFFAPSNVVIVDSPGLDDPVPYRSEISSNYLPQANIVLVCLRSNRAELQGTELKQLSNIFQTLRYCEKDRIIVIGTQIDEQRDMLGYWQKYTLPEYVKYLSTDTFYGSEEEAKKRILPVSAFYYFDIKECIDNPSIWLCETGDGKDLQDRICEIVNRYYNNYPTKLEPLINKYGRENALKYYISEREVFEKHKNDLLAMTQVKQIRKMISDEFIQKVNDVIIDGIKKEFVSLNKEINITASDIASTNQKVIDLSNAKDLKEQIRQLEKHIANQKEYQKKIVEEISNVLLSIETETDKVINKLKNE